MEPLWGMVKVSSLRNLDDIICSAYDLEPTLNTLKGDPKPRGGYVKKLFGEKEGPSKAITSPPP